ncbi:ATP-binding protein
MGDTGWSLTVLSPIGEIRAIAVAMSHEIGADEIIALCDANRLEQVMVNLIANALDAIENTVSPSLRLRSWREDERAVIEVHDNGPGLPEHVRAHLFEPLHDEGKQQGLGARLGHFVGNHASFRWGADGGEPHSGPRSFQRCSSRTRYRRNEMGDNIKILIVEDEPNVRLGFQQTLELEGMDVEALESAEKARRLILVDFPGIVVTDIRLPGDDGMALMHDLLRPTCRSS